MAPEGSPNQTGGVSDCASWHEAEKQISLTVERLRHLPPERLRRADAMGGAPADRAFDLSRQIVGRGPRPSEAGSLPRLDARGIGDQLAVTAWELLDSARAGGDQERWDRTWSWLADEMRQLRKSLESRID